MSTEDEGGFYASPGPMTVIPADQQLLAGLPTDAESLCQVSRGLIGAMLETCGLAGKGCTFPVIG